MDIELSLTVTFNIPRMLPHGYQVKLMFEEISFLYQSTSTSISCRQDRTNQRQEKSWESFFILLQWWCRAVVYKLGGANR